MRRGDRLICIGMTFDGYRCRQLALKDDLYCWYHNPADPHKFGEGYKP